MQCVHFAPGKIRESVACFPWRKNGQHPTLSACQGVRCLVLVLVLVLRTVPRTWEQELALARVPVWQRGSGPPRRRVVSRDREMLPFSGPWRWRGRMVRLPFERLVLPTLPHREMLPTGARRHSLQPVGVS